MDESVNGPKRKENSSHKKKQQVWKKPPKGFYKLNVDGACSVEKIMKGGGIIRNEKEEVCDIFRKDFGIGNAITAEAMAVREGVLLAKQMNISNLWIEGDNLTVLKAIEGQMNYPWEIDIIITDIRMLLAMFDHYQICQVPRKVNSVADFLFKTSHRLLSEVFNDSEFRTLVRQDALGKPP